MNHHLVKFLKVARDNYASAPDHSPHGSPAAPGCYCLCTALDSGWRALSANVQMASDGHDELLTAAGLTSDPVWGVRGALIKWNASATTKEVLAAFDVAITAAES